MRLLIVNPNTSDAMTAAIQEAAQTAAGRGTEVQSVRSRVGPRSVEGHLDEALTAAGAVERVVERESAFDAFVFACYGHHPSIDAA